jgi:fatty-acyl-CoA synthase
MSTNIYSSGLDRREANYAPLTPIDFLLRSASVYPDQVALIDGEKSLTWSEVAARCRRLASSLRKQGIGKNDTVAIIAPNSQAIYEAHFGVPMAGAVLNTINTRLDADTIAFILGHGEAKVLFVDAELADLVSAALAKLEADVRNRLLVVDIEVEGFSGGLGSMDYEALMERGNPDAPPINPEDEWDAISLNYTSGTTGNPKGVVYHHRGAYLNALSNIVGWEMVHGSVYLWTLPMFHCNGWCFPWSLAAVAGTNVCLRNINAKQIFDAIAEHKVTHFCGAPIIMNMMINAAEEDRRQFDHQVSMMTAAAPPPAAVLESMENAGFKVTHVYGLTETYGPAVICAWKPEWEALDSNAKAQVKSRQGVRYHVLQGLDVMDPQTMQPVEADGEQMGETMFRGNIVMKGYLKNPQATEEAFAGGWFHSGDLGVIQPDRYLKLRDRSKDIIISGGENISSIEVEDCLYQHPQVAEAAVVAKPDDHWGETPCAFVGLKPGASVSEKDIIDFCRDNLAHYKCPKSVVFGELPKTSTGKIQKFKLRDRILGGEL